MVSKFFKDKLKFFEKKENDSFLLIYYFNYKSSNYLSIRNCSNLFSSVSSRCRNQMFLSLIYWWAFWMVFLKLCLLLLYFFLSSIEMFINCHQYQHEMTNKLIWFFFDLFIYLRHYFNFLLLVISIFSKWRFFEFELFFLIKKNNLKKTFVYSRLHTRRWFNGLLGSR